MRLLVVGDHLGVLRALSAALRTCGARGVSATTLREARADLRCGEAFDAAVCEQELSDGTAFELLGWMRWRQGMRVPFLLVQRSPQFEAQHHESVDVMPPPRGAGRLLAGCGQLLRAETGGLLARQIPFAADA